MASQSSAAPAAAGNAQKRIHSLVVDTGPLINNTPTVSTLLAQAEKLYTIPSVLAEIKDEATRSRVHTTLLPFLTLRHPTPDSIRFITAFARRTGDLEVLSKPDIHLLALCYELELERNGGDWRLRRDPGQKGLNGKPPVNEEAAPEETKKAEDKEAQTHDLQQKPQDVATASTETAQAATEIAADAETSRVSEPVVDPQSAIGDEPVESRLEQLNLQESSSPDDLMAPRQEDDAPGGPGPTEGSDEVDAIEGEEEEDDDSDGGWITPSNLKKHQAKDASLPKSTEDTQKTLEAALITSDFAMQNVALRVNLNLVSPSNLLRIKQLKTWVLRCHGCYNVTRLMDRQFCPKCGQPTLTRVSCHTDAGGNVKLHLKKNFQYNKRGNVYSIPKPTHGTANGKLTSAQGGGRNHWGADLILAEDQKEYTRKAAEDRRARQRDLMDEDYLPNLISGERSGGHGRIRVGAGRNVNAKKRK